MGLKIVRGPGPLSGVKAAAARVAAPASARELQFRCDACGRFTYARLSWDATPLERQQIIKQALDEHRKVCTVGVAEDARKYDIWYPRT